MRNRKNNHRRTSHPRRGITLLFVVSMIVLFLLMGTAFVVVASDFLRGSKNRARVDIHTIDGTAIVEQAIYDVLRGPSLNNTNSPLRGQDILSDMYGYGFKAFVNDIQPPEFVSLPDTGNQFFRITLTSGHSVNGPFPRTENHALDLLDPLGPSIPLTPYAGVYNGLVITIVADSSNGSRDKGVSTRIVRHEIDSSTTPPTHWFWLPVSDFGGGSIVNATYLENLKDSQVIVNGREFSGTLPGTPGDNEALYPNRKGETLVQLKQNYLTSNLSTNEPYDAADYKNMFLSGIASDGVTVISSFHREKLGTLPPGAIAQPNFRVPAFTGPAEVDADNNGSPNAYWMDIGEPILSNHNGLYFKPLVAYHIIDLDGRLNLNAHGNLVDADPDNFVANPRMTMLGGEPTTDLPRGQGWGPPEISLKGIFNNNTEYAALLASRYGTDGVPGDTSATYDASRAKLFGHPFARVDWTNDFFGTVGNLFASSPMDLHGRFATGTPQLAELNSSVRKDRFVDPNLTNFPNGMPVIDMLASNFSGEEFTNSPYEMSFAPLPTKDLDDRPFTPEEFERLLRPYDFDTNLLPQRLWDVTGDPDFWNEPISPTAPKRRAVTTESFEVPTTFELFQSRVLQKVADDLFGSGFNLKTATLAQATQINNRVDMLKSDRMIAPELLAGLRMDVNRPLGNGYDGADDDNVVDNPGEESSENNIDQGGAVMDLNNDGIANNPADANARIDFAKQLYCLVLLVTDETDFDEDGDGSPDVGSYKRAVAQWAINVVDFRDPDSIMTQFFFDLDPWDGWSPGPSDVVWGCERPELLLTETLSVHPRRSENLNTSDPDFEQGLRPEPFAFIELYNPWTQNSLNQQLDSSLYNSTSQGVALAKTSLPVNGTPSPVWRISIDRPDRTATNPNLNTTPLRFVYFTNPDGSGAPTDTVGDDDSPNVEVFYSSFAETTLLPGSQALVGSLGIPDPSNAGHYRSFMGRLAGKTRADEVPDNLQLDNTRYIDTNPAANTVERFPVDMPNPRYTSIVAIDQARLGTPLSPATSRPFSVSDPISGYPLIDNIGNPQMPVPDGFRYTAFYDDVLDSTPDSNRNADDITEIMTEAGMAKNFRVIRLQRLANPLNPWNANSNPYITIDTMEMDLIAFNGVTSDPDPDATPAVEPDKAISLERGNEDPTATTNRRILWNSNRGSIGSGMPGTGDHYFNVLLVESLGKTNDLFTNAGATTEPKGFPWLTWNNRPFVSHLELVNVPYSSPEKLTLQFSIDDGSVTDPYTGVPGKLHGRFGHLWNFFAFDTGGATDQPDLYRVMEFLEVPSRFLGTESNLVSVNNFVQNPFSFLPRYRVPGKINLNTMIGETPTTSVAWEGLMGKYATIPGGCNWSEFIAARNGNSTVTDFENPFRPAGTGMSVPAMATSIEGIHCTLFRENMPGSGQPLFDFESTTSPTNDTDRSAYFRNAMRQRLANLTTTRSSVFAIWVTVGYFETNPDGTLKIDPMTNKGVELGADRGEVKRNRGFCIFDRSIPVAFEPGQNHNIERAILVKTMIE